MNTNLYSLYLHTLKTELIPALGCTEPISIALACAKARQVLGTMPKRIVIECTGNIVKNAKSVLIPNSQGLKGIEASGILGAVGGDPSKGLEVLAEINTEDINQTKALLSDPDFCIVKLIPNSTILHIITTMESDSSIVSVEIKHSHTHFHRISKDGVILLSGAEDTVDLHGKLFTTPFSLSEIFQFSKDVKFSEIEPIIGRQKKCNLAIAEAGLNGDWGANIGKILLKNCGVTAGTLAKALPAAASDARMSGCSFPVIINSGSGNQGITASLPVIAYARYLQHSEEHLYRSLVLSNLVAIYQKQLIGKLSSFCGVVSAAVGAGAGIAYLHKASFEVIQNTIINTLANTSGIICDGAKPSCAAKIVSAVSAAQLGFELALNNSVFQSGDGIVRNSGDETIQAIGLVAQKGMEYTDQVILEIMLNNNKIVNY